MVKNEAEIQKLKDLLQLPEIKETITQLVREALETMQREANAEGAAYLLDLEK